MRTRKFFFRYGRIHTFKLLVLGLYVVKTLMYLFSPDCSFEICEKPSKCPHSICRVRIVIDYADKVSA